MADYKVWKLSEFTGGLNSFTDERDLSANEFSEFTDIYSAKKGVIKPIGQAINKLSIPPKDIIGSLLQGGGFSNYNSDYTFQSELSSDLSASYTQLSEVSNDTEKSTATFDISSCLWLFEKTFPIGGTLKFTPTLRSSSGTSVQIGSPITIISGTSWLTHQGFTQEEQLNWPDSDTFWGDGTYGFQYHSDSGSTIFQGATPFGSGYTDEGYRQFHLSNPSFDYAAILNRCWKLEDNTPDGALSYFTGVGFPDDITLPLELIEDPSNIGPFSPNMFHVYNNHPLLLDAYFSNDENGEWNSFGEEGVGIHLWNDPALMLGGKTGAPDSNLDLIPIMGNHEKERESIIAGKAAGYLHARWAFGFWNGQRYANRASEVEGVNITEFAEEGSFYMPSPTYDGINELTNRHTAAYLHMKACLMQKIVNSINDYDGSGTTDKWTASFINPSDSNNNDSGIAYDGTWGTSQIKISSEAGLDPYVLNDYEVFAGDDTLTVLSDLKPSTGASYPVSGTTPAFVATYDGSESGAWIDSLITTDSAMIANVSDVNIKISEAPFPDSLTATYNDRTYVMNILKVGLFIKIGSEIMRIVSQEDMGGYNIRVERGNSTGWGNKTNSTINTHNDGDTILICNHGIGWEGMGGISMPESLSEWHIPLIPIVLEGDTRTHGGTVDGGRFLSILDLSGLGSGDILRIRFGPAIQTYYFTTTGDFAALGTQIENSFSTITGYHAKALGEHYDSDGYSIIFYNTPSTKRHTTVNEALTSSTDTSLVVALATDIIIGSVLAVGTELVYVTAVDGTTLTVIRAVGGTSAPSENHQWPVGTSVALMRVSTSTIDTTFEYSIEYGGQTEIHFRGDDEHIALITETDTFDSNYVIPGTDGNSTLNLYKTQLNMFSTSGGAWLPGFSAEEQDDSVQAESKFDWTYGQPVGKVKSFVYHFFNNTAGSSDTDSLISGNWPDDDTDFGVTQSDTSGIGTGCTVDLIPSGASNQLVEVIIALSGNNYQVGDTVEFTASGETITCEVKEIESALLQFNDPVFWNESNRLRIADGNFTLPNDTKFIGFLYNENMFKTPTWSFQYTAGSNPVYFGGWDNQTTCPMSGILVGNNDKIWKYSVPYSEEDTVSLIGLNVRGSAAIINNDDLTTADRRRLVCYFERVDDDANIVSDWTGDVKFYASAVYDDGSQSLPTHCFQNGESAATIFQYTGDAEGTEVGQYRLKLHIGITVESAELLGPVFPDPRIVGIHLYMASSEESFEQLWSMGEINFFRGFEKAGSINSIDTAFIADGAGGSTETSGQGENYIWNKSDIHSDDNSNSAIIWNPVENENFIYFDTMPKVETFEAVNGYSFSNSTLSVKYKTATIGGRRTFVGNIAATDSFGNIEYHNDRMLVSPVNQLDIYPYPGNILDLDISDGDKIVALHSLGDKILQFKERIMYVINISTGIAKDFYVEDRFKYRGVKSKNHICETSNSIFWFNNMGAFLYDGEKIVELFIKGGERDETSSERIDLEIWTNFISKDSLCGFNPKSREIFVVKKDFHTTKSDADAFIYNEVTDTWTFSKGKFYNGVGRKITNFVNIGDEDKLSYMYEGQPGDSPEDSGGTLV